MGVDANFPLKRRLLAVGLGVGAVGAPLVWRMAARPSPPAGDPMSVRLADLPPGGLHSVSWQGRTVWILRRTPEQLAALAGAENDLADPNSEHSLQPESCRNRHRSRRPEIFVAIGQCTHQGCQPALRQAQGDFLCPCHTSRYDLAGRVYRQGPAPFNLVIPDYRFKDGDRLIIGEA